jgi:hypothetical protein
MGRVVALLLFTLAGCGPDLHPGGVACARLSACADFAWGGARGYDACAAGLRDWASNRVPLEACILEADDCAAARLCLDIGDRTRPCEPDEGMCDGAIARRCFAGVAASRDCAAEGLECFEGACVDYGWCVPKCDGDRAFACSSPVRSPGEPPYASVTYCEPGRCFVDELDSGCHASDEPCSFLPTEAFCEGDTLVRCDHGRIRRSACAEGRCVGGARNDARCEAACISRCDGATLVACLPDAPAQRIDCTSFDSPGCIEIDGGVRCAEPTP